ncbi:MAG TPA: NAD(+) diphosphatase [Succinivibrionaceae bacterium]|nr:NAD(+) diphosphatase [Succinivibrionaceae bacterium]
MIQDITPKVFKNQFKNHAPRPEDTAFVFNGQDLMISGSTESGISFPKVSDFIRDEEAEFVYLFEISGKNYFLVRGVDHPDIKGFHWDNNKILRCENPKDECFAGETALHLYTWYSNNAFCGHCGKPTFFVEGMRALECPKCKNRIFPHIAPAVIVGVVNPNHDKIVITRFNQRTYRGTALISGFCEIGESAESAIVREVEEEVGLKVKNIRYYGSQPWGFDGCLLFGYFAEVDGSITIRRQKDELAAADWVSRDDIPVTSDPMSLTNEMIMFFKDPKLFENALKLPPPEKKEEVDEKPATIIETKKVEILSENNMLDNKKTALTANPATALKVAEDAADDAVDDESEDILSTDLHKLEKQVQRYKKKHRK